MKTIDELLEEGLTSEHYRLIRKYYKPYWNHWLPFENTHDALKNSTSWAISEEGWHFWEKIYLQLLEGSYGKYSNNIFLKL